MSKELLQVKMSEEQLVRLKNLSRKLGYSTMSEFVRRELLFCMEKNESTAIKP